jgi:hypothetical protein
MAELVDALDSKFQHKSLVVGGFCKNPRQNERTRKM